MKKRMVLFIIGVALAIAPGVPVIAAEKEAQKNISFTLVEVSNMKATVTDIDYPTRMVKLTDAEGNVKTIKARDDISNLNEVKKGDKVTLEVQQTIDVEVQPGPGNPLNIASESQTSPMPGQKPMHVRTIEGTLKTRVDAIDYAARTVTFMNRKGVPTTYKFGKDAKRFDEVRKGDMLVIEYKQITALSVK